MILAIGLLEVEWRQPFEDLCGTSDINIQGLSVCSLHSVIQFHPHLPQKPRTLSFAIFRSLTFQQIEVDWMYSSIFSIEITTILFMHPHSVVVTIYLPLGERQSSRSWCKNSPGN